MLLKCIAAHTLQITSDYTAGTCPNLHQQLQALPTVRLVLPSVSSYMQCRIGLLLRVNPANSLPMLTIARSVASSKYYLVNNNKETLKLVMIETMLIHEDCAFITRVVLDVTI